jgi:hypothetical protein
MHRTIFLIFFSFFLFIAVLLPYCMAAEADSQIRLAMVDTGISDKLPASFLDLLLVSFKNYPDIALIERTEVDKILKEQALSLSFSAKDVLQPGRIQFAHALLMLESVKSDSSVFVRIRLVDTRYGLKLWDAMTPLPAGSDSKAQAQKLAESAAGKLRNFNVDPQNLIPLGVSAIRSEELTPKWDWLSDSLAFGIEQNLALYPGVILMERFRTEALRNERTLTQGLPEALRPSAVFIDGSFRIVRQNGQESVSLYLRCRKQQTVLFETKIEDSVENVGKLHKKAVEAIIAGLGKNRSAAPMDPTHEAQMLVSEANAYRMLKDPERALPLAEAAVALIPEYPKLKIFLIQTVNENIAYQIRKFNRSGKDPRQKDLFDAILEMNLKSFPTLETIALGIPADDATDLPFSSINDFISNLISWANNAPRIYPNLDGRQKEAMRELSREYWQLYSRCSQIYNSSERRLTNPYYRRYLEYLAKHSSRAFVLCESADDAVARSRDLVLNQKYYDLTGLVESFKVPIYAEWAKDNRSAETVRQYLEELTQNSNAEVRIYAERAGFYFYSNYLRNYREAARHLEIFVNLLKSNNFMIHKEILDILKPAALVDSVDFANPIIAGRFSSNLQEDDAIKFNHLLDLVEYSFHNKLAESGYVNLDTDLAQSIIYIMERAAAEYRAEKFAPLLQQGLKEIQSGWAKKLLETSTNQLKTRYPGLLAAKDASQNFNFRGRQIFTVKSAQNRGVFLHRLAIGDKGGAIVYSDSRQIGSAHYGVIPLSGDAWSPGPMQALPFDIRFERKASDFLWERDYTRKGPAIAVDGNGVYVGFYQGGIVINSRNAANKILNEKSGLATDYIRSLEILDGKLYALVGAQPGESGLMEVDPESGASRLLFSSKTKSPEKEPDGSPICGIAADPEKHALWILFVDRYDRNVLSLYYPQSQKTAPYQNTMMNQVSYPKGYSKEYSGLSKINDHLIIEGIPDAMQVDLKRDNAFLLFSMMNARIQTSKWNHVYRMTANQLRRFIPVNEDLIGISDSDLMYFRNGDREPKLLGPEIFLEGHSRTSQLKDIALTPQGLLVLTEGSLYLIPEIVERPNAIPASADKEKSGRGSTFQ